MLCPTHGVDLIAQTTGYGIRRQCPEPGCTMACWDGKTSTPADDETRRLRNKCHRMFDPLWKKRLRFNSRTEAYRWLARQMSLAKDAAHIGMFDKGQCERLLKKLEKINA